MYNVIDMYNIIDMLVVMLMKKVEILNQTMFWNPPKFSLWTNSSKLISERSVMTSRRAFNLN